MNYYNQIKTTLIKNEAYKKVKDYFQNKSDLNSYFEVGRLLVEAQGGEARAKYGNKLIKKYSERLTKELGKGYSTTSLKQMRQFYIIFQKSQTLSDQLTWSHYVELLNIKNSKILKYYIYITESQNLSVRELKEKIKSNEYERIGFKEELKTPKVNTLIKNPIIINTHNNIKNDVSEYTLHQLILEDLDNFLKELGIGFTYCRHEAKIKIDNISHRIDFLLFNIKYNCYIVVEIKVTKMKAEYIGQVLKYINYTDKYIKELHHDKTIGIIICRKEDNFILEYCTNYKIFTTVYKLNKK